ncbi:unnamed protein product [Discula destructiva]
MEVARPNEAPSPASLHASSRMDNRRARAPTACSVCRRRKVKCDVTSVGTPCQNCVRDGHECQVSGRKARAQRQSCPQPKSPYSSDGSLPRVPSQPRLPSPTSPQSAALAIPYLRPGSTRDEPVFEPCIETDSSITTTTLDTIMRGPEDYAIESLATSLMGTCAEATTETFYTGDQQGIGYILDVVGEPSGICQHHGLPYMTGPYHMMPEDVAYVRSKGAFSVPSASVCEALLEAYFHHVHPILPVVDAAAVLTTFNNGGASSINLMLLWSMFSVAASYVRKEVVCQAGFASRKEMKKSMFMRAKCFYDNGCEKDRLIIIQSASLLSFWYSDLAERTDSWHWMGIAIGLCQTLGLNRDPDRAHYNKSLSDQQRQLWRRIWWSCFYRDRWLSFGMGRPMRINACDCDTPIPPAEDLTNDFSELPPRIRAKYMPPDLKELADQWLVLLNLSQALGTILSENYCPTKQLPSQTWVEAKEQELRCCIAQAGEWPAATSPARTFYFYHLQLHFNAASIALWRPHCNKVVVDVPPDQEVAWLSLVTQKIQAAAASTSNTLEKIISEQLVGHIGPMTVPVFVPAMTTHLSDAKSSDPLRRQLCLNRLNVFMMVLRKIQDVYPSATFIHGLFAQAIERITAPDHFDDRQMSISDSMAKTHARLGLSMDPSWEFDFEVWDTVPHFGDVRIDDGSSI